MAEPSKQLRCAIYTRKSTEEGLGQAFNSLDAQRESGEAFIASQQARGWVVLREHYDDGGYSGAHLDRPALQRLLEAVDAGEVDCVMVYKVDRLSRSLLDFARLMERFERQGVSFVSVTQEFNTTTSMGRLTLNVLLSFAQFEREIIGERTRDKLSAARRKGKWIGGWPVVGYDIQDGRLVVNPEEAEKVREIYRIAAEAPSLEAVVKICAVRGYQTKGWSSRRGKRDQPGFRGRGLLARFLFGLPKSPLGYRRLVPCSITSNIERDYRSGIRKLLEYTPEDPVQLQLSESVYFEWKAFQRAVETQFRDGGMLDGLKDWGSKLPGAALRLAGVLHFVEHIGHAPVTTEVSCDSITRAVELATCLISHARAVFALMERDPSIDHAQKLVSWIVRQGKTSFTVRDCFRAHQNRFKRVDAMSSTLQLLEQHGYIRRQSAESSGGRKPSDVCEVNPAILLGKAK